jgi:NitT/TauT family transport system permease protein
LRPPKLDANLFISCASIVLILGIWQASATLGWVDPLFTSSPIGIAAALIELARSGDLWVDIIASAKLFLAAFVLSVAVALPGGVLLGWYRKLSAAFDPFLYVLYVTPRIALIPLIFVWFGVGFRSQLVIVFVTAFFPLLVNVVAGVRSIDQNLVRVAKSFMARDRDIFLTLALPSALPFIVSGLRLTVVMALIGVVVAEFFTGQEGLGALITTAGISMRTDIAFAGVIVVAVFALVLTGLVGVMEKRLGRWRVD